MTTDLEKQFFGTFGVEPKKQCYYWDCPYSTGNIVNDTAMNERDCNSCKNPNKEIYPQITDRILLELICIIGSIYIYTQNRETLKEHILVQCMNTQMHDRDIKHQVQALFKEG